MKLAGKICLITGGTKGIGAATALELARRGGDIAINGRAADEEAMAVKAQIDAMGRRCLIVVGDVSKPAEAERSVAETVSTLGDVNVLVHSAGGLAAGSLLDVRPEDWYQAFDMHVHAIFHLCRAAVPRHEKES